MTITLHSAELSIQFPDFDDARYKSQHLYNGDQPWNWFEQLLWRLFDADKVLDMSEYNTYSPGLTLFVGEPTMSLDIYRQRAERRVSEFFKGFREAWPAGSPDHEYVVQRNSFWFEVLDLTEDRIVVSEPFLAVCNAWIEGGPALACRTYRQNYRRSRKENLWKCEDCL